MSFSCEIILVVICTLLPAVSSTVKPVCQPHGVTNNGTHTNLTVMCFMRDTNLSVSCSIAHRLQGQPTKDYANIVFSNWILIQSSGGSSIQCSWTAVLNEVKPGVLQIQAKVTPNNGKPVYSDWTNVANLKHPTVSISPNCPSGTSVRNGYILAETTATCRCEVTLSGDPPGFAQWYKESGDKIGSNERDGSAILNLHSSSSERSYFCQPVSILNSDNLQRITFTPQFAVGPTSLTIDMSDSIPLCPNQNLTYQVTCKVPANQVWPRPLFTIIIENDVVFANVTGTPEVAANKHYLSYAFRPVRGGVLRVYCKVVNEIFPELMRNQERPLIIADPPQCPPALECLNCRTKLGNKIAYLVNGSDVNVKCSIEGGYPQVSNITIKCGQNSISDVGTITSLLIEKPNLENRMLCHCSAWHVSKCYNVISELIIALEGSDARVPSEQSIPDSGTKNFNLTVGLASGLGCMGLILIVVAVVVVIYLRRRGPADGVYSQPCNNSCDSYQYASFVRGNTSLPPPPPFRHDSDSHYATIPADNSQTSLKTYGHNLKQERTTDAFRGSDIPEGYEQPI